MPKKPIKPDRVRMPAECRRADLILNCIAAGAFPAAIIIQGLTIPRSSPWLKLLLVGTIIVVVMGGTIAYSIVVNSRWKKRVRDHNGLLCPQCTYPLAAIQENQASVTCPECGYVTEDTSKLLDRWHKTLNRKALRIEIRLGKDTKQSSSD